MRVRSFNKWAKLIAILAVSIPPVFAIDNAPDYKKPTGTVEVNGKNYPIYAFSGMVPAAPLVKFKTTLNNHYAWIKPGDQVDILRTHEFDGKKVTPKFTTLERKAKVISVDLHLEQDSAKSYKEISLQGSNELKKIEAQPEQFELLVSQNDPVENSINSIFDTKHGITFINGKVRKVFVDGNKMTVAKE